MAAFLLSLREGLEAALIIGILLGAVRRFGRGELGRFIWYGVAAAVAASAAAAGGLVAAGIELEGRAEAVFEGVMLILAAGFLTGMIFWMRRQGAVWRASLAADVREAAVVTGGWGLFAIAFLAVAREGIELALLLVATTLQGGARRYGAGPGARHRRRGSDRHSAVPGRAAPEPGRFLPHHERPAAPLCSGHDRASGARVDRGGPAAGPR